MGELAGPTTETRLLDAATKVFAEAGFAGARVDEIARRARANKAMIYYHFGTKRELYQAVLRRLFSGVRAEMERLADAEADPVQRLVSFYTRLARLFEAQPALPHLMLREVLAGGRHIHLETARGVGSVLDLIRGSLEEGARSGRTRPAHPLIVHLSMIGPIALHLVGEPLRRRLGRAIGPEVAAPSLDALLAHLELALARGLQPEAVARPEAPGRRGRTREESR